MSAQTDHNDATWTTDLLIVRLPAPGALTAAVTAAELGLQAMVIEKGHLWGGTSATSGGTLWIPCSRHMAEAGVPVFPRRRIRLPKRSDWR